MFEYLTDNMIWLILSIIFICIELMILPGIGFLFAGLAALSVSGIVTFASFLFELDHAKQIIIFLFLTGVWTIILWKPLKKALRSKHKEIFSMKGQEVTVIINDLASGEIGQVSWSGSIFRAQIDESFINYQAKIGTKMIIKEINGNLLIIQPKNNMGD